MNEDTPGSSALMGDVPLAALPPGATTPAVGREQAFARLNELRRDPAFEARVKQGDPAAVSEIRALTQATTGPTRLVVGDLPEHGVHYLDKLQEIGGLNEAELAHIRENKTVLPSERKWAEQELARLKGDSEFVALLQAGQRAANRRWLLLHGIITSKIAS